MAKQRGGSPFTDSWFEMPFWILFFLLVVAIILMWHFDVFNKPAVAQAVVANIVKPKLVQPELTIFDVIPQPDAKTVKVSYSTKYATHGQYVAIRMYDEDDWNTNGATEFKNFPIGKGTVTVENRVPAPNKHFLLESLITSGDDGYVSPLMTKPFKFGSIPPTSPPSSGPSGPQPFASVDPSKKAYTSPSLVGNL
jgi:hypothetical protein